jgi:hypothetical protein
VQLLAISPTIEICSIIGIDWTLEIQIVWFSCIVVGNGSYNFKTNDLGLFNFFLYFLPLESNPSSYFANVSVSTPHVAINLLSPPPKCT